MNVVDAIRIVDQGMSGAIERGDAESVAYGLMLGGSLVHTGSAARADHDLPSADSGFRIASMTKSFTAATILALRDEGALSVDDRIDRWLPQAACIGLPAASPPILLRHLLTMTAGFPTDDPWGDRQESLPLDDFDALIAGGLTFCRPPGIDFEYSNLGYALLGRVITAVTGQDYRTVVGELLHAPLGMTRTTYDVAEVRDRVPGWHRPSADTVAEQVEGPSGAFSPMGGLWSCVSDLARWVELLESAWADGPATGPVSRWTLREMQRPHILARIDPATEEHCSVAHSYGMGLYVSDDPERGRFIHHSGGYPGYGSHMRWHPDTRWAIVALANRTYAPMGRVCGPILDAIVEGDAADARRERAAVGLWSQTRAAMAVAESLLETWDDALLDAHAAVNLDLDQWRDDRRATWARLSVESGPFARVPDSIQSGSPAHARWRMSGARGDVWLEVLLTPESIPRIQTLRATPVENEGQP